MSPQRISWNRYTDGPLQPISLALNGLPARLVMRPSRWRNPYPITPEHPRAEVLAHFRTYLTEHPELVAAARRELRGKNLACRCRLDEPCHGDIWLALVNA